MNLLVSLFAQGG